MSVHGDWLLTPARAAVHLPTVTAVLSDLHLGYAETRRGHGEAVPAVRLEDMLAPLGTLFSLHDIKRLVIAGDLFEAGPRSELARRLLAWVKAAGVELLGIVPGNHDRNMRTAKCGLPVCAGPMLLGGWHVVHGDTPLPDAPVVQGHLHPCLRLGRGVVAPCYLASDRHLILPAYSAETAGLNVLRPVGCDNYRCHGIVGDSVLDYGDLAALRAKVAGRR
jgi:metallophosphoesterase superfamily enzyme